MSGSRRARGWAVAVVAGSAFAGFAGAEAWAGAAAGRRAEATGARLRARLAAADPVALLTRPEDVVGTYRTVAQSPDGGVDVAVQVDALWESRCVVAHRAASGAVSVRVVPGRCA